MNKVLIDSNDIINLFDTADINIGLKYYSDKQGFVNTAELEGFIEGMRHFRKTLYDWIIDNMEQRA